MRILLFAIFISFSFACFAQNNTEEKLLVSGTGDLVGTLYLPKQQSKKLTLVIIQPGSGATDRNGNSLPIIKGNSYKLIAEGLAEKNIATLLIDKRGIAASAKAMRKEADLRFDDYAKDLADWVRLLKKDPRITKIYLAGHSEGSLVAMLAAQMETVDGYISIAGAGESIDKIIVWQYKQQIPRTAFVVDSLFSRLRNNEPIDTVPPMLMSIFRPSVQPYIASWLKYNPCEEIKKLAMPILIVQGTTDIQVQVKQAEMLHACEPKAMFVLINGMNHVLKDAPLDRQKNIKTYSDDTLPLQKELVPALFKFLTAKRK